MERRKKEQLEKEALEARIQEERQIREVQLARLHCERLGRLLVTCRESLASWAVELWQHKQVSVPFPFFLSFDRSIHVRI